MSGPYANSTKGSSTAELGNSRVYVQNLAWDVTWQILKDYMRTAGNVISADVVKEPDTGRSKGYGLVHFASARDAENAINKLNNTELNGRNIFMREDRENTDTGGRQSGSGSKVYVGNLSYDVTWQDLKDHMRGAGGRVVQADVAMEPNTSRSKGYGLVTFASAKDAEEAISRLNESELKGRNIFLREDREAATASAGSEGVTISITNNASSVGGRRVYVGNLSYDVSWQGLKDHLRQGGLRVLKADVLADESGRSKGCGVAEFATEEDAARAIQTLNNTQLNGRLIFIREDREPASAAHTGSTGGPSGSAPHRGEVKLYVGNLAWGVRWQELKDHCKAAGISVAHADVRREVEGDEGSRSRGYGFVSVGTPEEAQRAIDLLDGSVLGDRQITVREDREA